MPQHEERRLRVRITRRRLLRCLLDSVGPWPSAFYGLNLKQRASAPGEAAVRARVLHLLKQQRLTRTQLAERIGVTKQTVSKVLNGTCGLPPAWIPLLAAALNVTEAQLVQGTHWVPCRGGVRHTGPPPPRLKRSELPAEQALRLRLKGLLVERGLTQQQIASVIGVSRGAVACVLNGRVALPPAWLAPLAAALNVTVRQIARGTGWAPRKHGRTRRNRRHA